MATIRRLADSCLLITTDAGTDLLDPGFFSFQSGQVDLDTIGDVQRVLITHEHADHVHPDFVRWLVDRGDDVTVHANQAVVDLLAKEGIDASTDVPTHTSIEDGTHEMLPNGLAPPNRAWTVGDLFTHPGDSQGNQHSAPVMALPLLAPWGHATGAVEFAARVGARQVIPIHDFYMDTSGRRMIWGIVSGALEDRGIELVQLDWNESMTV